jgi:glycosyltransferase involved in cell wall biosynthesis
LTASTYKDSDPLIVDLEPYQVVPSPQQAADAFGESEWPTVLFLSRIDRKKSIETLISALAILRDQANDIRLLIAGTGDDEYLVSLKRQVEELNLSSHVRFLGMVVGDLKPKTLPLRTCRRLRTPAATRELWADLSRSDAL